MDKLVAAYLRKHKSRSKKDVLTAMVFLIKVVAEFFPPAAQALTKQAQSRRTPSQSLQQLLRSVPASILRAPLDVRRLLEAPDLAQRLEISEGSVSQYASRLRHLLDWVDTQYLGRPHRVGKLSTPAWIALCQQANALTERTEAGGRIGWLGYYCETRRISPEQLTAGITEDWYAWLEAESGLTGFKTVFYSCGKDWETLATVGRVSPVAFYHRPPYRTPYILDPDQAPPHLRAVYDEFVLRARSLDPRQRPTKGRLGPRTIEKYHQAYFGLLGVMKLRGTDLKEVSVVSLFTDPQYVEALCQFWYDQAGGAWRPWHRQLLCMLRTLGKTMVVPRYPAQLVDLKWLDQQITRLGRPRPVGQSKRIPLADVEKMIALIRAHSERLQERGAHPRRRLVALRDLVAFLFFRDRANRGGDWWRAQLVDGPPPELGADPEEVRGYFSRTPPFRYMVCTKPKEIDRGKLPPESRPVFLAYLAVRQELGIDSPWLLVNDRGDRLSEDGLNTRVRFWSRQVGLDMHLHDFRHVYVTEKLAVDGDVEKVKALFGDRSRVVIETHYDEYESIEASKKWSQLVDAHLQDSKEALPRWARELLAIAETDPAVRQVLLATLTPLVEED